MQHIDIFSLLLSHLSHLFVCVCMLLTKRTRVNERKRRILRISSLNIFPYENSVVFEYGFILDFSIFLHLADLTGLTECIRTIIAIWPLNK